MQRKKVGILTFHCGDNAGSVLQAYALQQVVREYGFDCDIINYQKKGWKEPYYQGFAKSIHLKLHLPFFVSYLCARIIWKNRFRNYVAFRRKYLNIFPKKALEDIDDMEKIATEYDKFIVGSDQVWNYENSKVDDTYFFNFTNDNSKKIAYAASFAKNYLEEEHREIVSTFLKQIPYLSVRESHGVDIIRDLTGGGAQLVLDPSLLLTEDQWRAIAKLPKEKDYIITYSLERTTELDEIAVKMAKTLGLRVIRLTNNKSNKKIKGIETVACPSPTEWLGYILNAKYVVANSFHGLAFSINFKKQFFAVSLKTRNTNSRIFSLLDQFDLADRVIIDDISPLSLPDIDYTVVHSKLQEKRQKSRSFLQKALEGDNL